MQAGYQEKETELAPAHYSFSCRFHMVATLLSVISYFIRMTDTSKERTFIMVKPDGVQRGLVGEITKRFETRGYKLVAMKMCKPGKDHLKEHYSDLSAKPFFPKLVEYMDMGPVVAMVWEGRNAVAGGRKMLGETDPQKSLPGSIRGDFCLEVGRNICHGSDSVESAKKEISHWFSEKEICDYTSCQKEWVYE